ncbi:TIGR02680 family protein [Robertmurraya kyonggiensis]|uniref:TIGR02680 family protein n=1 Tax=Robertmurraya kyonggiensis TaxID=1037680 RepID=A0A4U1DB43_9BACI|nr:TIGR02680 family protein [Robertmurraya kyonggiensis]TKC19263.1 TIGR02680 family protein [Robertmurraya kyonggiensis]
MSLMVDNKVDRWFMYRAVLYNFWYYPNQELIFKDGCAVLRGHNGSGKSVTTQSLITVLLDGDTRPHKLDPFGGKERKITDTVLGEEQLLNLKHRTGYIALEFKKRSGITKTIGMGIEANREKKKSTIWYFVVDGKRIGEEAHNLRLYSKELVEGHEQTIALTEKELRDEIENRLKCGKVYNHRDEYAKAVNKHLFGFDDESYSGLIDLLHQARSPKLSDQNKPEGAAVVLNESLPQLTEEELRPLMSSIESIDRIEKDLVGYKRDLKRISALNDVYQSYNEIVFAEKADAFLKASKQLESTKREVRDLENQLQKNKEKLAQVRIDIRKTRDEIQVRIEEKANLGVEEIESLRSRKEEQENNLLDLENRLVNLTAKKEEAIRLFNKYQRIVGEQEFKLTKVQLEHDDNLEDIRSLAELMEFEKHLPFFEHYDSNQNNSDYSFVSWRQSVEEYKSLVEKTKIQLEEVERLNGEKGIYENSLGTIRMLIDECQKKIDDTQEQYENRLTQLRENIVSWKLASLNLQVSNDLEDKLLMNLEDVYEEVSKEEYLNPLIEHYEGICNEIKRELMLVDHKISMEKDAVLKLDQELKKLIETPEIEPDFVINKRDSWAVLSGKGIEYIPFYEAFEFKSGVGTEQQVMIQNALYESGILSSVIVAKEEVEVASEITTVLTYGSEKQHNLSEVLISADPRLEVLLRGISFEFHEDGFVLDNGSFKNSFVMGLSSLYDENVFIGKSAREVYRQKKIQAIQQEIDKCNHFGSLVLNKETLDKQLQDTAIDFHAFPLINDLEGYLKDIRQQQEKISLVLFPQRDELSNKIAALEESMKQLKAMIQKAVNYSNLKLDLETYKNELSNINEYFSALVKLESNYKEIHYFKESISSYVGQVALQERVRDESHSDMVDVELAMEKVINRIKILVEQLENLGDKEILNRVQELSILINKTLPEKIENLTKSEVLLDKDIKDEEKRVQSKRDNQIPLEEMLSVAWEKAFKEQLLLGIYPIDETLNTIEEKAQFVLSKSGHRLDKGRANIGEAKRKLSRRFMDELTELPIYELELENRASEYVPVWVSENPAIIERLNYVKEQMTRDVVTLEVDEVRVSPGVAVERLTKRIADLEEEAHEKDRRLYQDILINSLGAEIRKKIQYVERWEKEMNNYMEHENIIKFRIRWVPKKADPNKEDEMDTRALVDALKKDSRWVDIDKIAKHFRTKIEYAKDRFAKDGEMTLQEIMKKVLDYRSWFEFQIYFTKKGDKEKPLNRNTYGELSGGQRVLAMVTPVLAALYAKYSEGREDAPRIFTLDEAFARVDDENIKIMFDYIYKLGFNYILNSQSLWGTFETVPSLNIYELSRPDNRPFVAIQSYYWNGHKRERIGDEWFAQERESAATLEPVE